MSTRYLLLPILGWLLLAGGSQAQASSTSATDTLRIGFLSNVFIDANPQDAKVAMNVWAEAILSNRTLPFKRSETNIYGTFDELAGNIRDNKIDIIALNGADILNAEKDLGLKMRFTTEGDAPGYYEFGIYASAGLGARNLEQLRGKSIIVDYGAGGDVPNVWLKVLLARKRLPPPAQFFSSCKYVTKPTKAITPVFFGQADACLVRRSSFNTMCEMNAQVKQRLTLLESSPAIYYGAMCYSPGLDPMLRQQLDQVLLGLTNDPACKQIMTLFKFNRLILIDEAVHLQPLRNLYSEYKQLGAGGGRERAGQ